MDHSVSDIGHSGEYFRPSGDAGKGAFEMDVLVRVAS